MEEAGFDDRGMPAGQEAHKAFEVAPREAQRLLDEGAALIDCRTAEEYETVHLERAQLLPLHELQERLDEVEAEQDEPLLVICHHGIRSRQAALMLQQLGFPRARSIFGGIDLWSQSVDPSVPRYVRGAAGCRIV